MDVMRKASEPHMGDVTEADVRHASIGSSPSTATTTRPRSWARGSTPASPAWTIRSGLGGLDASPKLQEIVDEALEHAGRRYPWIRDAMGIGMCGPTIVARGTREQQERFLRPIFTAEEIWCQLFSEPGAGFDVAGLATRAERDGDEWVVNGSKIWTSMAHKAGASACCSPAPTRRRRSTRASPPSSSTCTSPAWRYARSAATAGASGFNEVFFTNATAPDAMHVGEVGDGWRTANADAHERTGLHRQRGGTAGFGPDRRRGSGVEAVRHALAGDARPADAALGRRRGPTAREPARPGEARKGVPGPEGSVLKLLSGRVLTGVSELVVDLMGPEGTVLSRPYTRDQLDEGEVMRGDPVLSFVGAPGGTIAGGHPDPDEHHRQARVGLPREPGLDRTRRGARSRATEAQRSHRQEPAVTGTLSPSAPTTDRGL